MAQTIAAVRGNQAYTPNNSNELTIYTNGSNSTRVIINSLAFIQSSTNNDTQRCLLLLRNSTGGADVPVAMVSQNACTTVSFTPGQIPTGQPYAIVGQSINFFRPSDTYLGTSNSVSSFFAYCPKSIWMGPSDVLIYVGYNSNTYSGNVVWNFTTISES